MKKIKYMIGLFLLAIMLCSCSLQPKPEETIQDLEEAMNRYDMEAVLDCYEPSVRYIYDGAMEIGGSFAGFDLKALVNAAGGIANIFGDELVEGGMPEIKIDINSKKEISSKEIAMNITIKNIYSDKMKRSMSSNAPEEETMDIYLVLIDNKWYISAKSKQLLE